ncbi:MAG: EAL domain-containing protein, partial [Psychrobium sp.]|nr:EAL domain-containing protein [Psychrobium sp.]
MNEIILESLIAITALIVFCILFKAVRKHKIAHQPGSRLLLTGFALLVFSFFIDITDNFPQLGQYVVIGDTQLEAFIEKGIGSFLGMILLATGLLRWLPAVFELTLARKNIAKLNGKLEQLVEERTHELHLVNEKLRLEMSERAIAQEQLDRHMLQDPLTGLPNRYALLEYLEHERTRNANQNSYHAVFLLDLDQFKAVNDSLGHAIGDKVLKAISNRLAFNHRSEDFLGRLGGDEFVLVLSEMHGKTQDAALLTYNNAVNMIELVTAPLKVDGHELNLSASIGITVFNYKSANSSDDILRQADIALYHAKDKGQGLFSFFQPEMQKKAKLRLEQAKELHQALHNKELFLHYQPQVNQKGQVIGVEALLRWLHPEKGIIDPSNFIALAEDIGIIDKLGRYILHMACQQSPGIASSDFPNKKLKIAINISPTHFFQEDFVEQIISIISQYSLDNVQLVLEITEEVVIGDVDDLIIKMNQLRKLKIHFSLDDFGTGYSSLTYLKKLPIDTVKIDRSFIQDLHQSSDDESIVKAILTMTQSLGIDVIAEGIENEKQFKFLDSLQCAYYQGYYFGKPQSIHALIEADLLVDNRNKN